METAFTKHLDLNNLELKLLEQHWAPFCSMLGAILYQKKTYKNTNFRLTRP